ncbi:MAG: Coenzyme F420 hydrogenase/dehydrogenase, beta subunit C-terminal domain [Butyricicoccus sp.]|nr:Coenzyme F420 hydrogenase/dehydrogenase, beta subunit C-terminal domain [Butyricicoccus sp.]
MEHITDFNRCTGCAACADICPVRCITMTADAEGFLRPVIDHGRCIDCGKCARTCPVNAEAVSHPRPTAYAAINTDEETRRQSSSGGVFALLAHAILADGGAVCAPVFAEDFSVRHIVTRDPADILRMQGSKYVQSNIADCYAEVRTLLEAGTSVLFSGTPCQTGGLRAVLNKEYDHLYLQDIICHGVPSPKVWEKYLAEQGAPVKSASFRDKSNGWLTFSMRIESAQGVHCRTLQQDPYLKLFLRDLDLRPSCYDCAFKSIGRPADLTLADYWGVGRAQPDFFDGKGTSLLLVHSAKGKTLLDRISPALRLTETDLVTALSFNPAADHSVARPAARETFFADFDGKTIAAQAEALCRETASQKAKNLLRRAVNKLRK